MRLFCFLCVGGAVVNEFIGNHDVAVVLNLSAIAFGLIAIVYVIEGKRR